MPKAETETPRPDKIFPVSLDQFHRDSRALAWRLHEAGPFEAIVCITRGGLVPAAIVARELNVRMIETVCVVSYRDYSDPGQRELIEARTRRALQAAQKYSLVANSVKSELVMDPEIMVTENVAAESH